jgi:CheY-like chemotaxis protein
MINAIEKDELKSQTKITVLLVDDDRISQFLHKRFIQELNCEVLTAENGANAIALFKEKKPDFIFLDIQLPDTTGFEVAKAIRALETSSRVPIVALTGTSDGTAEKCQLAGIDDYLIKPVNLEQLLNLLKNLLPFVLKRLLSRKNQ